MVKIGILEFLYHHIFLYSLALVARESGAEVTIFTTEKLYGRVASLFKDRVGDYRWVIRGSNESLWSFLKRVEKIAGEELDLLFVNTLDRAQWYWPIYVTFNPKCRKILVTGRVENWFGGEYRLPSLRNMRSTLNLLLNGIVARFARKKRTLPRGDERPGAKYRFPPLRNIRSALHLLRSALHLLLERSSLSYNVARFVRRKRILPRFDGVVVHTQSLKDYVLAHHYEKDIFVLPFSIYGGSAAIRTGGEKIKFVVAGAIAEHRRDYDGLLNAFEKLWTSGKRNITLTLLGRPVDNYGERIISRCRLLKETGFDIRFYDKYIPEEVFSDEMALADVIINPIRLETYHHGTVTAGLVEAIRHAKPGIYPAGHIVPEEVSSSSLFYTEIEELPHLIEDRLLNTRQSLKELSQNALTNSEKFSLSKVSEYFKNTILTSKAAEEIAQ